MKEQTFVRWCVAGTFIAAIGALWEAFWWHEFFSFDLYGAPPHFLYHFPILVLCVLSFVQWYRGRRNQWLLLCGLYALILLNIPLQTVWNETYGIPSRSSLTIYWSFPYTLPAVSFVLIGVLLFRNAPQDYKMKSMILAWILAFLLAKTRPFRPTGGVLEVWGPWGASVIGFGFFFPLLLAMEEQRDKWFASRSILFYTVLLSISGILGLCTLTSFGQPTAVVWRMLFGGFRHPPGWILAISFLSSAVWLDYAYRNNFRTGIAVAAFIGSAVLYGTAPFALTPEHTLSMWSILISIISFILGGITASACVRIWSSMCPPCKSAIAPK